MPVKPVHMLTCRALLKSCLILSGLALFSILAAACKQSKPHRSFREIIISPGKSKASGAFDHSSSQDMRPARSLQNFQKTSLQWVTPQGWSEQPGRGMRTATFIIQEGGKKAECALIQLPDSGGGLETNIKRWMQQLKIIVPPPQQFQAFVSSQQRISTAGGFTGTIIDLTALLSGDITSEASGLTAVIPLNGNTLFLTLFGDRGLLNNNKQKFSSLCRSLKAKD